MDQGETYTRLVTNAFAHIWSFLCSSQLHLLHKMYACIDYMAIGQYLYFPPQPGKPHTPFKDHAIGAYMHWV